MTLASICLLETLLWITKLTPEQSKTDPFRNGVKIIIGRAEGPLCPGAAVLAYMALRGPGEGPLFRFQNGPF